MPYISKEDRQHLDLLINNLALELQKIAIKQNLGKKGRYPASYAGALNYVISRLIGRMIPELRYWHLALITGVLENVKQEFYRRIAEPYEDKQIKKNSDITEYEYLNECIRKMK